MPTRREFLSGLAVGGASTVLGRGPSGRLLAAGAEAESPGYVALLADTHVDADSLAEVGKTTKYNMTKNLEAAVADVLKQPERPKAAVVVGDLARSMGQTGDYERFLSLIRPLRDAGVPVHLAMGNHDDRDHFLDVLKPEADVPSAVESRYVGVADAAGLRLVILDSLEMPRQVGGKLHAPQRAWLAKTLDAQPKTPTLVMVHHNPAVKKEDVPHCLADAEELLEILRPRAQVKALVFGHTHTWSLRGDDGLHLVNLPAVGYPFADAQPIGWCRLEPRADGATIVLRRNTAGHVDEHARVDLKWRAG
jgi:Icc protein